MKLPYIIFIKGFIITFVSCLVKSACMHGTAATPTGYMAVKAGDAVARARKAFATGLIDKGAYESILRYSKSTGTHLNH